MDGEVEEGDKAEDDDDDDEEGDEEEDEVERDDRGRRLAGTVDSTTASARGRLNCWLAAPRDCRLPVVVIVAVNGMGSGEAMRCCHSLTHSPGRATEYKH